MKKMVLKNRVSVSLTIVLLLVVLSVSGCFKLPEEATAVPAQPVAVVEEQTAVSEEVVEEVPVPEINARETAVSWLMEQQNEDGGFGSFAITSTVAGTIDGLLAIRGSNPEAVAYLADNVEETAVFAATNGGSAGKVVLALTLAGEDPANFADHNFVIDITNALSTTGQFAPDAFNQSLAMMGLNAAGEPVPAAATEWLIAQQADDGSWDDGFGTTQNADATAMAIVGLMVGETAVTDPAITAALAFLHNSQLPTGGWEYGTGYGENANSTAMVVQTLNMLGEDVTAVDGDWAVDGISPMAALLGWQNPETGAFQADFGEGRSDNLYATVQSLLALP